MARARLRYRTSLEDSARWEEFAFRPGDIVISAPSKSGTTWTQMICALLIFQTVDLPAPLTALSPWLDMRVRPVSEVRAQLDAQRHRRFIKTHTPLDGLPADPRVTYVVVGRDPRDVAVSLRHQGANLKRDVIRRLVDDPAPDDGSTQRPAATSDERESLLQWMYNDESPLGNLDTLRGAVWHLAGGWHRRHDPNVVMLHYSDLSRDLEAEMRRLAGRLDITVPAQTWPALVEAATFDRMRERSDDLVPDERVGLFKDNRTFFRSGSSGQWQQWLTDEDVVRYEERVAALAPPDLACWMNYGSAPEVSPDASPAPDFL